MSMKSKVACQFSIADLAQTAQKLYLWTFTFADLLDIKVAAKRWSRFVKDRHRGFTVSFPDCSGIRVFEMHRGRWEAHIGENLSHGLHIHMVVNRRLDVDIMRSKWEHFGGGRINVRVITPGHECYVAKYLSKARGAALEGLRLWAPINFPEAHKVRDIKVECSWTDSYKTLAAMIVGFPNVPWPVRMMITNRFMLGDDISGILQEEWKDERDYREPTWEEIVGESPPHPADTWPSDNAVRRHALNQNQAPIIDACE